MAVNFKFQLWNLNKIDTVYEVALKIERSVEGGAI